MVLYDFYADWCSPCKAMEPIIADVEKSMPVVRVNVDTDRDAVLEYSVSSVPTYIVVDDSREIARVTGAMPKFKFLNELGLSLQ